jgi:hypothetical protein
MSERDRISKLLARFRRRGVLVDANMLLLKFVGDCIPEAIESFRRTRQFTLADYSTLQSLLRPFHRIVTTPHILTEVSNLAGQIDESRRRALFDVFAAGIAELSEESAASAEISAKPEFRWLGLTDAGIVTIARARLLVLTVDLPLSSYLERQHMAVLNFNHIRLMNWK